MIRSRVPEPGGRVEGAEPASGGAGWCIKAEQMAASTTARAPSRRSGVAVRGASGAAECVGAGPWRGAYGAAGGRGSRTAEGRWNASWRRARSGRSGRLGRVCGRSARGAGLTVRKSRTRRAGRGLGAHGKSMGAVPSMAARCRCEGHRGSRGGGVLTDTGRAGQLRSRKATGRGSLEVAAGRSQRRELQGRTREPLAGSGLARYQRT
jgi:hypothetical protein